MRRIASTMAMAALLASNPTWAFEAANIEFVGLHLGMQEAEVIDELTHQGFVAIRTPGMVAATTKDGRIEITLSANAATTRISYVFSGRGAGVPEKIREAVQIRYGDPDQATPPTWCRAVGQDKICPKDQASLRFLPDRLTLLLAAANQ